MKKLLFLFGLMITMTSYSQAPSPKTVKLDTIQICEMFLNTYPGWRNVIYGKFRVDSSIAYYEPQYKYHREKTGLVYSVTDNEMGTAGKNYKAPIFWLGLYPRKRITSKEDIIQFFKEAPKHTFNNPNWEKDSLMLTITYFRQENADARTSNFKNANFINNEVFNPVYKLNGIDVNPSKNVHPDSLKKTRERIEKLYTDGYLFKDSVLSADGNTYFFVGNFHADASGSSVTMYGLTRYKSGNGDVSFQTFIDLKTEKKKYTTTAAQRKEWLLYLARLMKGIQVKRS